MQSSDALLTNQLSATPHDNGDKERIRATELQAISRLAEPTCSAAYPKGLWKNSPSPSSVVSSSAAWDTHPSDHSDAIDHSNEIKPCATGTVTDEKGLLKQAFGSMVRERKSHSKEWRMLREAELTDQPSQEVRVRACFGIKWFAL